MTHLFLPVQKSSNSDLMKNSSVDYEKHIADFFEREYCIITGTGTSAVSIASSLTKVDCPKIILPAIVCFNLVVAVYHANKIPIFADVKEMDATIDPECIKKLLEEDKEIGAVVAVHLYGFHADITSLIEICKEHSVLLIEDAAQAIGGIYQNKMKIGSMGDCSIISFGHTKIIDVDYGGAFLTNDIGLYRQAKNSYEKLKSRPENIENISKIYSKLYYSIWEFSNINRRIVKLFYQFPSVFTSIFVYKATTNDKIRIINSLKLLDSEIKHRKNIYAVYKRELNGVSGIKLFNPTDGFVPWRFSFLINTMYRDTIINKIRSKNYDISCWYPNIVNWTPSGADQGNNSVPIASKIEKEIVNLWVSKDYDKDRAFTLATLIKNELTYLTNRNNDFKNNYERSS